MARLGVLLKSFSLKAQMTQKYSTESKTPKDSGVIHFPPTAKALSLGDVNFNGDMPIGLSCLQINIVIRV